MLMGALETAIITATVIEVVLLFAGIILFKTPVLLYPAQGAALVDVHRAGHQMIARIALNLLTGTRIPAVPINTLLKVVLRAFVHMAAIHAYAIFVVAVRARVRIFAAVFLAEVVIIPAIRAISIIPADSPVLVIPVVARNLLIFLVYGLIDRIGILMLAGVLRAAVGALSVLPGMGLRLLVDLLVAALDLL